MIDRLLKLERLVKWLYCKVKNGGTGGGIQSVQEGDNITVDNTDPLNPIISSTGGGSTYVITEDSGTITFSGDGTSTNPLTAEAVGNGNFIPLTGTENGTYINGIFQYSGNYNLVSETGDFGLNFSQFQDFTLSATSVLLEIPYSNVYIDVKHQESGDKYIELKTNSVGLKLGSAYDGGFSNLVTISDSENNYFFDPSIGLYGDNYIEPTFERVYVQKQYVDDNFCEEAPQDGNFYARQNSVWVDITDRLNP